MQATKAFSRRLRALSCVSKGCPYKLCSCLCKLEHCKAQKHGARSLSIWLCCSPFQACQHCTKAAAPWRPTQADWMLQISEPKSEDAFGRGLCQRLQPVLCLQVL